MAGAATKLRPIHEVRKANLNALIKGRFAGNSSECARKIERSHTFIWQLVQGYRGIGEMSARHIEEKLDLDANWLDRTKTRAPRKLRADDGQGNVRSFPLAKKFFLDPFAPMKNAPPEPCSMADANEKVFCAVIEAEDVVEVERGDLIFVDPDQRELVDKKLFLVQPNGKKGAVVLMAKKRAKGWWFCSTTNNEAVDQFSASTVTVRGRLISIVRHIPMK